MTKGLHLQERQLVERITPLERRETSSTSSRCQSISTTTIWKWPSHLTVTALNSPQMTKRKTTTRKTKNETEVRLYEKFIEMKI
jgi:hypothetical protein